jgi:hypothetical protein
VLPHIIGNHNLKHNYEQNTNNKQTNKLNTLNRFISDEAMHCHWNIIVSVCFKQIRMLLDSKLTINLIVYHCLKYTKIQIH